MWKYIYTNELKHYGVLGMKWGVRRYQNKNGSLTEAGRRRISKEYKKASQKAAIESVKRHNDMYIRAYNKAADTMNSGKNYAERKGYVEDYEAMFEKEFTKNYNRNLYSFYENDKNFKKAQELVKKYDMTSWDKLAKENADTIKKLKKSIGE